MPTIAHVSVGGSSGSSALIVGLVIVVMIQCSCARLDLEGLDHFI